MRLGHVAAVVLMVASVTTACTGPMDAPAASRPGSASTTPDDNGSSEAREDEVSPPRLKDLDVGAKPKLPYVADSVIVTPQGANIASPLRYTSLLLADNGVTLAHGPSKRGGGWEIYQVLDAAGGSLRPLTDATDGPPAISADGRLVAWQAHSADGHATVMGWDLERQAPFGDTATFPFKPTCCDNPFQLTGIDNAGRVYGTGGGEAWLASLSEGAEVQLIRGLRTRYIDSVAGNGSILVFSTSSAGLTLTVGHLDSAASFEADSKVQGRVGVFSADGRSLAYVGGEGSLQVRNLTSGEEKTVSAPAGSRFSSVVWEDGTNVLLGTETGAGVRTTWVRCLLDDLDCEIAVPSGSGYTPPLDRVGSGPLPVHSPG